jgi:hypothetical protein
MIIRYLIGRIKRLRRERNAYRRALQLIILRWSKDELTYQDVSDAVEVIVKSNK